MVKLHYTHVGISIKEKDNIDSSIVKVNDWKSLPARDFRPCGSRVYHKTYPMTVRKCSFLSVKEFL